ncbi:MAG TPA: FAD-dependent monooxygenase [Rectinema sp.]|nr:FAD-dependent monooxygenase [Rectinema sp.]
MTEAKTSGYDMVIAGAGPAGLAAGIAARKCGRRAVILEKGESAGPLPRGEGIHRYPLLDEVLGMDFWEKDCYRMDCSVVYHSPNDLHTTRKQGTRDIFFFEWRRLIERLVDRAQKAGVEIIYNAEVLGPIEGNENSCRGLRYRFEQKDERLIYGKAVLACDGYNSVLGRHYGIDYRTINCPMVKCIADNTPVQVKYKSTIKNPLMR